MTIDADKLKREIEREFQMYRDSMWPKPDNYGRGVLDGIRVAMEVVERVVEEEKR